MDSDLFDCFCEAAGRRTGRVVLLICAHPDDETIGAGARLGWLDALHLAYTTDGALALADHAARVRVQVRRRAELRAALHCGGALVSTCTWIGFGDQEASFHLLLLTRRVHALITTVRPEIVITHPYEGGHPDHDATAFAVAQARRLLLSDGQEPPLHLEFTSYHAHDGEMRTGRFLQDFGGERVIELGPAERERKLRMFRCFESQREVLSRFGVERESFRLAPEYNFVAPPHTGRLFYDHFSWGITGARWRDLAGEALDQLHAEVTPC